MEDTNDAAYEIVLYIFTSTLMTMRKFLFNEYNDANYQLSNYKEKIIMLMAININSSLMSFIDPTRDCFDTRILFLLSMINHKSPICLLHMIKEIIIRKFIPENNPIIEIDKEKEKNMSVIEIRNEERHVIKDLVAKYKDKIKLVINNSLDHECNGKSLKDLQKDYKETGKEISIM